MFKKFLQAKIHKAATKNFTNKETQAEFIFNLGLFICSLYYLYFFYSFYSLPS